MLLSLCVMITDIMINNQWNSFLNVKKKSFWPAFHGPEKPSFAKSPNSWIIHTVLVTYYLVLDLVTPTHNRIARNAYSYTCKTKKQRRLPKRKPEKISHNSGSWEDHSIDEEDVFPLGTTGRRAKTMTKSKFVALNLTVRATCGAASWPARWSSGQGDIEPNPNDRRLNTVW